MDAPNTQTLLSQMNETLTRNLEEESNEMLSRIYPALVENTLETMSRLPEEIFVRYFLPFFSGQLDVNYKPEILTQWIAIAGSPMAEVAIINPLGEVLYTVPGIFDTSFINLTRATKSISFKQLVQQAALLSSNIPVVGDRFLAQGLAQKYEEFAEPVENTSARARWIEIFKRYGITPAQAATEGGVAAPSSATDDELYD